MGVYVYKINRRSRRISGRKIHECVFAYKCGRNDDAAHRRYVAPMQKKWEESGEDVKNALFVMDYDDGAEVYRRNSVAFYDTGDFGEVMGHLRMEGTNGKLRFEPEVEKHYKVTFTGAARTTDGKLDGYYPNQEAIVFALNEKRAITLAKEEVNNREGVQFFEWKSRWAKVEKFTPPMTEDDAIELAMRALRKLGDVPLSDRVKARALLSKMKTKVNGDSISRSA